MIDVGLEFQDYPDTSTPFSATNFNEMQENLISNIVSAINNANWPIGRGFIDFTNTDYSDYLGFTWVRTLVGMTPVGLDTSQTEFNTVGKTGGAKTHTLTANEIPAVDKTGNTLKYNQYFTATSGTGRAVAQFMDGTALYGGQAHPNLQPYEVVSFWKRTA